MNCSIFCSMLALAEDRGRQGRSKMYLNNISKVFNMATPSEYTHQTFSQTNSRYLTQTSVINARDSDRTVRVLNKSCCRLMSHDSSFIARPLLLASSLQNRAIFRQPLQYNLYEGTKLVGLGMLVSEPLLFSLPAAAAAKKISLCWKWIPHNKIWCSFFFQNVFAWTRCWKKWMFYALTHTHSHHFSC